MYRRSTLALVWLAFAGAAIAAGPKSSARAAACIADEPAFWRDQGLTTKVATRLQFHKPLFRERVEVKVSGRAAVLSGNLSSQKLIQEAVRTAAAVDGIKCVQNYLRVGPPLPAGQP